MITQAEVLARATAALDGHASTKVDTVDIEKFWSARESLRQIQAFARARRVGPWALFVWLRLLVGLVFPLVVSWAAVQTARTRSMESATGLLYINVGTIAAGTILAAGLYFGAGLLV